MAGIKDHQDEAEVEEVEEAGRLNLFSPPLIFLPKIIHGILKIACGPKAEVSNAAAGTWLPTKTVSVARRAALEIAQFATFLLKWRRTKPYILKHLKNISKPCPHSAN